MRPFRQLELALDPEPHAWYLAKLDSRWAIEGVVDETDFIALVRCHRTETPTVSVLIYVPLYGRIVEDVYVDDIGHIRMTVGDRLLA